VPPPPGGPGGYSLAGSGAAGGPNFLIEPAFGPAHTGRVDVEQGRDFLGGELDVEVAIQPLLVAGQGQVAGLQLLKKARVHLLKVPLETAPVLIEVLAGLQQRLHPGQGGGPLGGQAVVVQLLVQLGQQGFFLLYVEAGRSQLALVGCELCLHVMVGGELLQGIVGL
jgi:hypothetical protein